MGNASLSPFEKKLEHPNVLLCGAPRSGSSSLIGYLQKHPQVTFLMGGDIERGGIKDQAHPLINPFGICKNDAVFEQMELINSRPQKQQIPAVSLALRYALYMPHIAFNILETVRKPKILFILRDPVRRTYSSYTHQEKGTHKKTFLEMINVSEAEIEQQSGFKNRNNFIDIIGEQNPSVFVERSCYYPHIIRYFALFGRANIHVVRFEEMIADPVGELNRVYRFLGVDETSSIEEPVHRGESRNLDPIPDEAGAYLQNLYAPYNQQLFELLDWPKDTWAN